MSEQDKKQCIEELHKKRELKGLVFIIASIAAVAASLFHLYTAYEGQLFALTQRAIHLAFLSFLGYLYYPSSPKKKDRVTMMDYFLSLLSVGLCVYLIANIDQLVYRVGEPITMDWVSGVLMVLLVLELTRRSVGNALAFIAAVSLAYAYFGPYMPGILVHKGYSLERIFSYLFMSQNGIFGIPLGVSAEFIFLFILFGTFLDKSGAGKYFIDLAYALTGWSRGGPAKASVLASGLLGSISGSSVANAVTSGTFTIPLMKKVGYGNAFSAGVEAAASTGGQIMPPIMGAAAFIMAEFLGVPFVEIARAALVPAVLYFFSLIAMTHFRAGRLDIKPIDKSEVPPFFSTFISGVHLIIPLAVLIFMLFRGFSPQRAVFFAIVLISIIMLLEEIYKKFFKEKDRSIGGVKELVKKIGKLLFEAFSEGSQKSIQVAIACACAGIIVGIVTMTGLGLKLSGYIELYAQGVLLYGLILTMVSSLVLGIGLPTTAKYIVLATLVGPALVRLDVSSTIGAHLFILYFATDADITPPVSLTAYATAGLAEAEPLKASIEAFKLGLSAYLIPFIFIYNPALILEGDPFPIALALISATIGIISLSAAIQGYLLTNLKLWEKVLLFSGALGMIYPGITSDGIGIAVIALISLVQWRKGRKKEKEKTVPVSS